jgi:UDP-N-acetylmuramyl pentapeptide synthase
MCVAIRGLFGKRGIGRRKSVAGSWTQIVFVAVTVSCGKSVTTRLVAAILNTSGPCYRSQYANVLHGSVKTLLFAF